MIINQRKVKEFSKRFRKLKTQVERLDFLKDNYKEKKFEFHRTFLNSGDIYNLNFTKIDELIDFLKTMDYDNNQIIEDLDFLKHLMEKKNLYDSQIKKYIDDNYKKVCIEDLFNFLEYLNYNIQENGLSIDGKKYNKSILISQYDHMLESFPGIIDTAMKCKIRSESSNIKKINNLCSEIFRLGSHHQSIRQFLNATMMEWYKPKKKNNYTYNNIDLGNVYVAMNNPKYWPLLEIYRDLNFIDFNEKDMDYNTRISLAEKAECIRISDNNEFMYVDLAKGSTWYVEEEMYKSYELLQPMYGDKNNIFIYNNKKYKINDLLRVYGSIKNYIFDNKAKWIDRFKLNKEGSLIKIFGERSLARLLKIDNDMIELLRLLSYDINSEEKIEILNYKPLIRKDKVYYILPTWIDHISLERCIDKILSDEHIVKVELQEETQKGLLFENTIEKFFRSCNIKFFKVKRDEDNKIPEIDGMFIIDKYLFIFEAKASIKPETIMEAYNYLNSTLAKAKKQLDERIDVILNDKKRLDIIEEKIKINISELQLVPFVLVNHHYFNGYIDLKYIEEDSYYPIIDFSTLKKVIVNQKVPCWEFNKEKEVYKKVEIDIKNGRELEHYLKYQLNGLISWEKPTYQLLEDKILFRIQKPLKIE
ncbi:hypothetical protein [Clostridium butyricum]|uniref:hypothetical protein n=1 Tax=Clostridium butyricum TaxID=1492 RepID=UPI002ABD19CD|nr:hypothetical protein [Clostridium butyricum]